MKFRQAMDKIGLESPRYDVANRLDAERLQDADV